MDQKRWSHWASERSRPLVPPHAVTMDRNTRQGTGHHGPRSETRHDIYTLPQYQAEEVLHDTAPHNASGRRTRVGQRAADQPSEGAPAASSGVVSSTSGCVPRNNSVIPTPQIPALALASHGPGGGGGSLPRERRARARPVCPRDARPLRGQAGRR
eukprot:8419227-Pyramimonas_sp.AAC.1